MIIVDALLQGKVNGLAVAQSVRDAGIDLPIICLTDAQISNDLVRVAQALTGAMAPAVAPGRKS